MEGAFLCLLKSIKKIKEKYELFASQIDYTFFNEYIKRFVEANSDRYTELLLEQRLQFQSRYYRFGIMEYISKQIVLSLSILFSTKVFRNIHERISMYPYFSLNELFCILTCCLYVLGNASTSFFLQ